MTARIAVGVFLVAVLALAGLQLHDALTRPSPWVNHDVAFHAYVGLEMNRGDRLYLEVKDTNPPGSQFLQAALMAVGDGLGLPDFTVQHWFLLAVGLAGLAVLRRAFPDNDNDLTFALVALAYLLVLVRGNFSNNLYTMAPNIPYDFGQREQLFALVFLPYALVRLNGRPVSRPLLAWWVGVGFVAMFKPYWPPMVAAIELAAEARRSSRSWRSLGAVVAGGLLPFLLLLIHSPAAFVAFFRDVVPMHFVGDYGHYDNSLGGFWRSAFHDQIAGGVLIFVALWVWCWARRRLPISTLVMIAALVVWSYLAIVHQHKFWSYHAMLLFACLAVFGAWTLAAAVGERPAATGSRVGLGLGIAGLALGLVASFAGWRTMLREYPPFGWFVTPILERERPVMFFSMSVDYVYAPLRQRSRLVGPWTVHFTLPALLQLPEGERDGALAAYTAELIEDIDEQRPDLLVFAPYRQALPPGRELHEILAGLGVVPRDDYERLPALSVGNDPRLREWVVYRRRGAS